MACGWVRLRFLPPMGEVVQYSTYSIHPVPTVSSPTLVKKTKELYIHVIQRVKMEEINSHF